MWETIALVAAVGMPMWNIPLIIRMVKRKSSKDISLSWGVGVWLSLVAMAPAGMKSPDMVWRAFIISNMILFTAVVICIFIFRNGPKDELWLDAENDEKVEG